MANRTGNNPRNNRQIGGRSCRHQLGTDYARKVEKYALFGIPEYWIVDYRGLGGIAFIGKPKQPTVTVCQLVGEDYTQRQFRLGEPIASPRFENLQLRLDDVLPRFGSQPQRSDDIL